MKMTAAPTIAWNSRPVPASAPTAAVDHSVAAVTRPLDVEALAQDHAAGQKADARNDLRGYPHDVRTPKQLRERRKEGGADGDQRNRVQAGRALPPLALEADG